MPSFASFAAAISIAVLARAETHSVNLPSGFFNGPQTGIGSWFTAVSEGTNGKSWCGYPYSDSDPVFAVSLKAMGGKTYNTDPAAWRAATQKFCGLEASVKDPKTGKEILLYLGDAFDPAWVRSPSSIDIMIDAFSNINGDPKGVHDVVIQGVQWHFTGRVNPKFAAPGAVWPTQPAGAGPTPPAVPTTMQTLASPPPSAPTANPPAANPAPANPAPANPAPANPAPANPPPPNGNGPVYGNGTGTKCSKI